jgi:hypothetical protein
LIHGYTITATTDLGTLQGYFLNYNQNNDPNNPTFFMVSGNIVGTSLTNYGNTRIGVFFDQLISVSYENDEGYSCNINP